MDLDLALAGLRQRRQAWPAPTTWPTSAATSVITPAHGPAVRCSPRAFARLGSACARDIEPAERIALRQLETVQRLRAHEALRHQLTLALELALRGRQRRFGCRQLGRAAARRPRHRARRARTAAADLDRLPGLDMARASSRPPIWNATGVVAGLIVPTAAAGQHPQAQRHRAHQGTEVAAAGWAS